MNKKILICLLLISNTLIKSGTSVFVQNNTPYKFSIKIKQKAERLSKKYWKKGAKKISPWGKRTKILYTGRDTGVKRKKKYAFYLYLKPNVPNAKTLTLKVRLRGKWIGSKIWKTVGHDKYRDGNRVYTSNYNLGRNKPKLEISHKFYKAGTFNDILFVINPKRVISKKRNTINPEKITVLAYNTYFINNTISPGITKRSKIIPGIINDLADPDVIIFSETFHDNARKEILKRLKKYKYKYATCVVGAGFHMVKKVFDEPIKQPYIVDFNSKRFKKDRKYQQGGEGDPSSGFLKGGVLDGGVIIVSKYRITKAWEIVFKDSKAEDTHAKKGAVYAKINKEGKNYHIFGTHPQASYKGVTEHKETRKKQFASLKKFIDKMKIPESEPVILGGDLNMDLISKAGRKEVNNVLKQIKFSLPKIIGHKYSHDNTTNDFLDPKAEKPQLLDYILYSKNHLQPKRATAEVLIPRTKRPWCAKILRSDSSWKKGQFDLSDHYPVAGYFEYQERIPLS